MMFSLRLPASSQTGTSETARGRGRFRTLSVDDVLLRHTATTGDDTTPKGRTGFGSLSDTRRRSGR